jgi:RNA-directed DNA polymerase
MGKGDSGWMQEGVAMPKDAPPNGGAALVASDAGPGGRVSGMQTKLHCWAAADPGRRFDDLFNLVCDPATLMMAFVRVAGNRGARTAGVDGVTVETATGPLGISGFLADLRGQLKTGTFRPLPVRQRMIPKPGGSGKSRKLGIPTIADRVVQAALKLVLEPIFEADFLSVSYGFRPQRRAHDAVADIHRLGTQGYRWVLDADIEACFDMIDHTALMARVRARVKDKRVLWLVKGFLKAGVLTETGQMQESDTGTPQGGILSPLLANIALSVLDEQVMAPWRPDGKMSTTYRRHRRRELGLPTWRIVRYADDFVIVVHGSRSDVEALQETITHVLQPLGLRLSAAKTQIVHMSDGFDFLGFHIQWKRKRGTNQWFVYTFIASRPLRSVKAKIRSLTHRVSQANMGAVITRINQILRGWTNYFRHAVCKHTLNQLRFFVNWRLIRWLLKRHRWQWGEFRRRFTTPSGAWLPFGADGVILFNPASVTVTRYRYRGEKIPNPYLHRALPGG